MLGAYRLIDEDETTYHFGNNPVKKSKKKHCIEEYKASLDFVRCVCGFTGNEHEFDIHMGRNPRFPRRYLDFLSEMVVFRNDYPTQGTLHSFRSHGDSE
jgi:hypothetical protein